LRQDLVPVTCRNFLFLILGSRGSTFFLAIDSFYHLVFVLLLTNSLQGFNPDDGITYHYKGSRIHRILRGQFFQSGDLLDQKGLCSRSVMNNGGLFKDENFVLRSLTHHNPIYSLTNALIGMLDLVVLVCVIEVQTRMVHYFKYASLIILI